MVQAHNVRAVSPQLAPGPDRLINGVLTEGVWDLAGGHYAVSQQPVAAMSVRAGSGNPYDKAVVDGDAAGQGVYIAENQDAYSGDGNPDVSIANGGAQDRIDLVVLQVSDDEFDSSGTWGAEVVVIQGDEAASPAAPSVPDSALPLAEVAVAAGLDSGIVDAMITDRRVQARVDSLLAGAHEVRHRHTDTGWTEFAVTTQSRSTGSIEIPSHWNEWTIEVELDLRTSNTGASGGSPTSPRDLEVWLTVGGSKVGESMFETLSNVAASKFKSVSLGASVTGQTATGSVALGWSTRLDTSGENFRFRGLTQSLRARAVRTA